MSSTESSSGRPRARNVARMTTKQVRVAGLPRQQQQDSGVSAVAGGRVVTVTCRLLSVRGLGVWDETNIR